MIHVCIRDLTVNSIQYSNRSYNEKTVRMRLVYPHSGMIYLKYGSEKQTLFAYFITFSIENSGVMSYDKYII